jgi:hypothetical protein
MPIGQRLLEPLLPNGIAESEPGLTSFVLPGPPDMGTAPHQLCATQFRKLRI